MLVKTEGIILHCSAAGEADIIAKVFTEDHGIQSLSFKGIRKSRKRSHSAVEPGMRSLFHYRPAGQGIYTVRDFSPADTHDRIRSDFARIVIMHFLLESISLTSGVNIPDRFLFRTLKAAIETAERDELLYPLPLFFLLRILIHHGLFPEDPSCSVCGGSDCSLDFFFEDHHLVCSRCRVRVGNTSFPEPAVRFFRKASRSHYSDLQPFPLDMGETALILRHLVNFIEHSLNVEFRTAKILFEELYPFSGSFNH
jgi:DNA repair protein RecO